MTIRDRSEYSGVGFALAAYGLWGLLPLYWKLLVTLPAAEILSHRMMWSLVFLVAILTWKRQWGWIVAVRESPRILASYLAAGTLLAMNWGLYIWAVNAGYVVETALGYFMNPLVNVVLGWVFLNERLRRVQQGAIALAALGVAYLTWRYGRLPWIAIALAVSFGFYGLLKKRAPLRALEGLTLETALLSGPALLYVLATSWPREAHIETALIDPPLAGLLVAAGVVTALPLIFFAAAVRRLQLTTVGTIQYLAPTLQFLLGVFLFREPFDHERLVGFILIWSGIVVFVTEGLNHRRRQVPRLAPISRVW